VTNPKTRGDGALANVSRLRQVSFAIMLVVGGLLLMEGAARAWLALSARPTARGLPDRAPDRTRVSPAEYRENLRAMIGAARDPIRSGLLRYLMVEPGHANPLGSRLIAEALADRILETGGP
jgi:hypothetical protein